MAISHEDERRTRRGARPTKRTGMPRRDVGPRSGGTARSGEVARPSRSGRATSTSRQRTSRDAVARRGTTVRRGTERQRTAEPRRAAAGRRDVEVRAGARGTRFGTDRRRVRRDEPARRRDAGARRGSERSRSARRDDTTRQRRKPQDWKRSRRRRSQGPLLSFRNVCRALGVVFVLFFGCVMIHTYDSLVRYERSQPQVFLDGFVQDVAKGGRAAAKRKKECIDFNALSAYDSADLINARFDEGVGKGEEAYRLERESSGGGLPCYTLYADDAPFLTFSLGEGDPYTRLGLLTIADLDFSRTLLYGTGAYEGDEEREGSEVRDLVDEGFSCEVRVSDSVTPQVNGHEVGSDALVEKESVLKDFVYPSEYVETPTMNVYRVAELVTEPEVSAVNAEGEQVKLKKSGNTYTDASISEPNTAVAELPFDALEIAETWSKLMTDDLTGANHGLDQVYEFLVPDSELYDQATAFATGVDITFVTPHTLTGFSEEEVTNCIEYNDDLYACDVHFVKNITTTQGGKRTDEFDNTMIFAHLDNDDVGDEGWYLIAMQAIV